VIEKSRGDVTEQSGRGVTAKPGRMTAKPL
jgi:hypothetical protein